MLDDYWAKVKISVFLVLNITAPNLEGEGVNRSLVHPPRL